MAIYLPRGPILQNKAHDASNIGILRDTLPCHVVAINYRASKIHRYPTPVHDILTAYDWIIDNLLPKRAITRPGRSEHVGRLAVGGELLGGSLATSLALSECRIGEPGIVAAAVNNPIVDWTDLRNSIGMPLTQQQMVATSTGMTMESLSRYRDMLFRKPAHYFDHFASPMLLFRSSGVEVPSHIEVVPLDEMDELIRFEREESLREQLALGAEPNIAESDEKPTKKRKVSRRFPSKALGLRLPVFRLESGSDAVVSGQAIELAHQLRQSFERQRRPGLSRPRGADVEDGTDIGNTQDEMRHCWSTGLGLWDDTPAGKARMLEAAKWLRQSLVG